MRRGICIVITCSLLRSNGWVISDGFYMVNSCVDRRLVQRLRLLEQYWSQLKYQHFNEELVPCLFSRINAQIVHIHC